MGRTNTTGSSPGFVADWGSIARNTGRLIDWDKVPESYRSTAFFVTLTANAAAAATSLAVAALPKAVRAGQLLFFGETGEVARVTADAAAAATSLTVEALPSAIESGDKATIGGTGARVVKSGKIMAELASGKIIPRDAVTGAETSTGFMVGDCEEGAHQDALSGYGLIVGGVLYRELLPDRGHASFNTWVGEINTAGPGVRLETYSDSRAA